MTIECPTCGAILETNLLQWDWINQCYICPGCRNDIKVEEEE